VRYFTMDEITSCIAFNWPSLNVHSEEKFNRRLMTRTLESILITDADFDSTATLNGLAFSISKSFCSYFLEKLGTREASMFHEIFNK
jgi:hypothetical protein